MPLAPTQMRASKLHAVRKAYEMRVYDPATKDYVVNTALSRLLLRAGRVALGTTAVSAPLFEGDIVSFAEKTSAGFTSAMLHFTPDGRAFSGVVFVGATEASAKQYQVQGAVPPTHYKTTMFRRHEWSPGVTISLGHRWIPNGLPEVQIQFGDAKGTPDSFLDVSTFVSTHTNADGDLVLTINYYLNAVKDDPQAVLEICPLWPTSGSLVCSWDGKTLTGTMKMCDTTTTPYSESADSCPWTGVADEPAAAYLEVQAPAPLLAMNRSIAELATLSANKADELSYAMLIQNMKWAMDDDTRDAFFGEVRPLLSNERTALIRQDTDFYTKSFAPAYLGWSLSKTSGPAAPKKPLNEADRKKVEHFLNSGVAKDKSFARQSGGIVVQAFVAACPRLAEYINDTSNDWAGRLFNSITTTSALNAMITRVVNSGDMSLCKRYSIVLRALQPSGAFAEQYYGMVVLGILNGIAEYASHKDEVTLTEWLAPTIETFISRYVEMGEKPTEVQLQLHALALQLQSDLRTLGSAVGLAREMAAMIVAASGSSFWARMANAEKTFAEKYPRSSNAASGIVVIVWTVGLMQTIMGFQNWDNLSTANRATVVFTTITLAEKLIHGIPTILETTTWTLQKINQVRSGLHSVDALKHLEGSMAQLEAIQPRSGGWLGRGCRTVAAWTEDATGALRVPESAFTKYFSVEALPMKFLGVATAAAFVVISTFQLVDDIHSGADGMQIAFDAVLLGCNALLLISSVAALMIESVIFTVLGPIGAVLGMVFALVEMFRPRSKPKSPADRYLDEIVRPFVNTLPEPDDARMLKALPWNAVSVPT